MEISDISSELLRKAADGDTDAFEAVYRASAGFVYNVALGITAHRENAEEAVQEVFLKLFDRLGGFGHRSSFKTWLYRVTVNTALNLRKKSGTHAARHTGLDEALAQGKDAGGDPVEKNIGEIADRELVQKLLGVLSPDYRACLVLREMQGLSYEEISKALNVNINTVRTRLKRARELLMRSFEGSGLSGPGASGAGTGGVLSGRGGRQ